MSANLLFVTSIVAALVAIVLPLKCYKCGQYNDGVGSITPCINETYMKLVDCPSKEQIYCLVGIARGSIVCGQNKYTSEGTFVKDCAQKCTEKEEWTAKTFCCTEDGCNHSSMQNPSIMLACICWILAGVLH